MRQIDVDHGTDGLVKVTACLERLGMGWGNLLEHQYIMLRIFWAYARRYKAGNQWSQYEMSSLR
jgi:hypothetical protein